MSKVPSFSLAIIINENTLFDKVGFGKKLTSTGEVLHPHSTSLIW